MRKFVSAAATLFSIYLCVSFFYMDTWPSNSTNPLVGAVEAGINEKSSFGRSA